MIRIALVLDNKAWGLVNNISQLKVLGFGMYVFVT